MRLVGTAAVTIAIGLAIGWASTKSMQTFAEETLDTTVVQGAAAEAFRHRHQAFGIECTACHGAEPEFSTAVTTEQCLACHESHDAVAELTADVSPNPHHSHMGEVACLECHSEHQEPRLSCNQCHVFEMEIP